MIRPYKNEPNRWLVEWYIPGGKGKRDSKVIEGTEAVAKAYEASMRRAIPLAKNPRNPKIISIIDEFYDSYKINRLESTQADCKRAFKHLLKHFGEFQFANLSPVLLEQYMTKRIVEGVKERTVNRELTYFSSFMAWAVERKYTHPLLFKIKKFKKVQPPKPIIPHPSEVNKLLSKVEPQYKLLSILLYDMGLRRHEALKVQFEDVDLKGRKLLVMGKGAKEAFIPITTERAFLALQKACRAVKQGYLSVNPRTGKPYEATAIRKALNRAATAAKIKLRIYPHLLRHSFGTHATLAGMNPWAIKDIMRHADIKTTQGYTHLGNQFLADESKKFARYTDEPKKREVTKKKKKS